MVIMIMIIVIQTFINLEGTNGVQRSRSLLRPISVLRFWVSEGFYLSRILRLMGGILMSVYSESRDLSRDNLSSEIGRTPDLHHKISVPRGPALENLAASENATAPVGVKEMILHTKIHNCST